MKLGFAQEFHAGRRKGLKTWAREENYNLSEDLAGETGTEAVRSQSGVTARPDSLSRGKL